MAPKKKNSSSPDHPFDYDFIAIGSGPAGVTAALQASKLNKKAAIVEKSIDSIGGAWLHTGTIPSKTIREVLASIQNVKTHVGNKWADRLVGSLSTAHLFNRAKSVSTDEQKLIQKHLDNNNIEIIRGYARFEDNHTLRVSPAKDDSFLVTADKIMISTGSSPRRPPDIPFDDWRVVDSDGILKLEHVPESLAIYGAGVIGCEFACIFGALGVKTTLVDARSEIMQTLDHEVTGELKKSMEELGIEFVLGQSLKKISADGAHATLHLSSTDVAANVVFFAAGRVSNTKNLCLDRVQIKTNSRGAIVVNNYFQTEATNIYAAGDAIGPPALASTSSEQGRIAAHHAFGEGNREFPAVFPIGIYTIPEMSSVGKCEEELQKEGVDYVVGRASYEEVARGYIRGDNHGLLKILACRETQTILGIHIVGADAANLIHIGQCCMMTKMPLQDVVNSIIFNYPTLAEAYRVAAFNALNKIFPSGNIETNSPKKPGKRSAA